MPDRRTTLTAGAAILAVAAISLLFIASYAGALHEPRPHDVPVSVPRQVPAAVAAKLDASSELRVVTADDPAGALEDIDRRDSYGAIIPTRPGVVQLVVAPAASAAIADFLSSQVAGDLRAQGLTVKIRTVHPLPDTDTRGLVGFYTVVGWAIAGYLGATLFGLVFGTSPSRRRTAWRLGALVVLGFVVGLSGSAVSSGIAGFDHGFWKIAAFGLLTVLATGSVTVALQAFLGILGTGVAILLFVVFGNPAAGGPYAAELLPGLWRVAGQLIPTGASTTAVRDAAYFPDASVLGPLLVMLAWIAAGFAVALSRGGRGSGMSEEETKASLAGVA